MTDRREGKLSVRATKVNRRDKTEQPLPQSERQEAVLPVVEGERLSNVGFGVTYTKNIGNYESIRVNVDCHLPGPDGEEQDTYIRARKFVMKNLRAELARIETDLEK